MKKFIFLTVLLTGAASFAQSSSTSVAANSDESMAIATAVESSTTSTSAVGAAKASRWGISAFTQAATDVKDQQDHGSKALTSADNYLGVNYKLNDNLKLEIGYNFSVANVTKDQNSNADAFANKYMGRDPQITLKQTAGKIGSSDPVTLWYSYYVPMGSLSQQVKGGNGTLRNDTFTTFNLAHKISLMPWLSTRAYLGNSANKVNETLYRFNWGGSITYNFSDAFNVYYWPQTDVRTTGLNRGKMTYNSAGEMNMFQHEVGVNYNMKVKGADISINPAFVNHQDLGNGQGFGRAYYADNTGTVVDTAEIDFNVYASF